MIKPTVRCNKCDWEGTDEDLLLIETNGDGTNTITATETPEGIITRIAEQPKEPFFFKGCPNCKSDDNLIDLD